MRLTIIIFLTLVFQFNGYSQENNFETFEYNEGDTTYLMKKYYLLIYERGENRDHSKEEAAEIQKGHLAHISKLADEKKICIVGPMADDGPERGIIIYSVFSKEEASELSKKDPAVIAGRLTFRILPFWAAKGSQLF